jgi:hypothetical protein
VAGNNVISFNKVGKANVVFKIVGLKRGVMDYRNNVFIARRVGWRFIGRIKKDDFVGRHLKAAVAEASEVRCAVLCYVVLRCVFVHASRSLGWSVKQCGAERCWPWTD